MTRRPLACSRTRTCRVSAASSRQARRKLLLLDGAGALGDLRYPPGNRLEALKGNRQGQHSIRINKQSADLLRAGHDGGGEQVEIVDYR